MSRLGKKPISIPEKTEVTFSDGVVVVKGPNGELSRKMKPNISIEINPVRSSSLTAGATSNGVKDNEVILNKTDETKETGMLWGTYASHITNMIKGVNEGFEKKLSIEGVGFRAEVSGGKVVLNIGFSHPVEIKIPEGVDVKIEKNIITVSGIDKENVGQLASVIRSKKRSEPYKGKGIKYIDEIVRRKEGKKTV